MDRALIDRIYECPFAPEHWPGLLQDVARIADGKGGALFVANGRDGVLSWSASESLTLDMQDYVAGRWLLRDRRRERVVAAGHAGFLTERDLFAPDELNADPTVREFYRARGLGRTVCTGILLPTNDWFVFSVERNYDDGPVDVDVVRQLDELRPHIARSALVSARLQLDRARVASETLALIGLPALVFDSRGRVLAANALIEALTDHIRWAANDRIGLRDAVADTFYRKAVEAIERHDEAAVRSFAIRSADDIPVLVGHVIPIRRTARDLFVRCAGLLVLTPVALPQSPPVELVQSLFDLSPAESRVARRLAAGQTVEEIAATGGVSNNTVRTQVRGVLEKTGCRRQAEVVALLAGLAVSRA